MAYLSYFSSRVTTVAFFSVFIRSMMMEMLSVFFLSQQMVCLRKNIVNAISRAPHSSCLSTSHFACE